MSEWLRARRPEQKEERHAAILQAATRLVGEGPLSSITIGAIARGAGVAKGSVYLYFCTKEEVLLAVLQRQLADWLEETTPRVKELKGSSDADRVREVVVQSLLSRPTMCKLLASLNNDLEHNLSKQAATVFKSGIRPGLVELGQYLEDALPGCPPGTGMGILIWLQALLSGLWAMANPVGTIREVLEQPEMDALRVNFEAQFRIAVGAIIKGCR